MSKPLDPDLIGTNEAHSKADAPADTTVSPKTDRVEEPSSRSVPSRPWRPVAAGAVAGALCGLAVTLLVPQLKGRSQATDTAALTLRLQELERAETDRQQAAAAAIAEVQRRLDAQRETFTAAGNATSAAINALRQTSAASVTEALVAVNTRLQKLEQSDQSLTGSVRSVASGQSQTAAASLLAATGALSERLQRGAPFETELKAVEALAGKTSLDEIGPLAALRPLAARGAPTLADLRADLEMRRAQILAVAVPDSASVLDRLAASAGGLIKVRATGEQKGDDAVAVYSRIGGALGRDDLSGAVTEAKSLSPAAAKAAAPWLDKARSRLAADEAVRRLETDALAIITGAKN